MTVRTGRVCLAFTALLAATVLASEPSWNPPPSSAEELSRAKKQLDKALAKAKAKRATRQDVMTLARQVGSGCLRLDALDKWADAQTQRGEEYYVACARTFQASRAEACAPLNEACIESKEGPACRQTRVHRGEALSKTLASAHACLRSAKEQYDQSVRDGLPDLREREAERRADEARRAAFLLQQTDGGTDGGAAQEKTQTSP